MNNIITIDKMDTLGILYDYNYELNINEFQMVAINQNSALLYDIADAVSDYMRVNKIETLNFAHNDGEMIKIVNIVRKVLAKYGYCAVRC